MQYMLLVKILGMGDARHKQLSRNMAEALSARDLEARMVQVMDVDEIVSYRVVSIPAIVIGDQIFFQNNHVPNTAELVELLRNFRRGPSQDAA